MFVKRSVSSSIFLLGVLGLAGVVTPACSSKHRDRGDEELAEPVASGSLRVGLSARGASGALYRLRDTQFFVRDANFSFITSLSTENDPLATTLETTLSAGSFFIEINGGNTLEKVENGVVTRVSARLLSPQTQEFRIRANEETFVGYRFETNGEVVDFGQGRLVITIDVTERTGDPLRSVIETNQTALGAFNLRDTLNTALANAGAGIPLPDAGTSGVNADDIYHSIIDSYNTSPGRDANLTHCDSELTNGGPSLNGFPLACPRLEGFQFDNLDSWFPIAVVNRLDLAPADGAHCGQQRIVFANNVGIGNGRMFIIVEAQIPNPTPSCGVSACRPIAELWSSVSAIADPAQRGARLADAFFGNGTGSIRAFMNADHLGPNGGQIRTNNFNDFQWTLREFQLAPLPNALAIPSSVAEAPFGELWNDLGGQPQGDACRSSFIAAAGGLLGSNPAAFGFPVADACEDAESPNDFFRHNYANHLQNGSGNFASELDSNLGGTGLSSNDIANRARFAGSCMGCHIESSGAFLGNGISAPFREDFVHVFESTEACGQGDRCFRVSEALRDVFLPHRINVQDNFLNSPSSCGGGAADGGAPFPGPTPVFDAGIAIGRVAQGVRRTLGGQPVVPHAH